MASLSPGPLRRYRWKELGLLIIPFMILLLEMIQLPIAQRYQSTLRTNQLSIPFTPAILPTIRDLIPVLGLIAALAAMNMLLSFFFPKADQVLLPLVGLLSGMGVLMALRLGHDVGDPVLGTRQLAWVLLGLLICIATLFLLRNMNWLKRYKYTWALLGILLVALTIINALRVKNLNSPTHDQLNFGPLNLQPSELLKIFIVVFFAAYLSENRDVLMEGNIRLGPLRLPPLRQLGPILLMLGISLLLFLVIRELGLALLIYGIFLSMLYLGSGKLSYVIGGLLVFVVAGNMKFLPLTGIPLPFLSYGGSSIIANFIIIGILLRISHNTALERAGLA